MDSWLQIVDELDDAEAARLASELGVPVFTITHARPQKLDPWKCPACSRIEVRLRNGWECGACGWCVDTKDEKILVAKIVAGAGDLDVLTRSEHRKIREWLTGRRFGAARVAKTIDIPDFATPSGRFPLTETFEDLCRRWLTEHPESTKANLAERLGIAPNRLSNYTSLKDKEHPTPLWVVIRLAIELDLALVVDVDGIAIVDGAETRQFLAAQIG